MMNKNPKVTIIIPVYNGSNYVAEAIESALAQTYENTEVVVVNDGSRDNGATDAVVKKYADKVRYILQENGGVSSALNRGIEEAQGEYISWLSHDDLYMPDKVKKQVEILNQVKNPQNTIAYCGSSLITATGGEMTTVANHAPMHGLLTGRKLFSICLRHPFGGCSLMIHKSIFDRYGYFKPLRFTQDLDCWMRFIINGVSFYMHTEDKLVKYRKHGEQTTVKIPDVFYEEQIIVRNNIFDYLKRSDLLKSGFCDEYYLFLCRKWQWAVLKRFPAVVKKRNTLNALIEVMKGSMYKMLQPVKKIYWLYVRIYK